MADIEAATTRCKTAIKAIQRLTSTTAISSSCTRTLLKLATSELSFLSAVAADPSSAPLSVNIGHLEALIRVLLLPSVTGVSRVCKPLPLPDGGVHVDIVCTLGKNPAWIIVSDRNPRYISWHGDRHRNKGLRSRIEQILVAARSTNALRPFSIVLFFANGLPESIFEKLKDEFGACRSELNFDDPVSDFDLDEESEEEWINIVRRRSFRHAIALEIKLIDSSSSVATQRPTILISQPQASEMLHNDAFACLLSTMRQLGDLTEEDFLVNFDTTALVALVSGISNGGAKTILGTPEIELKQRFKGNTQFVIDQARSEQESPMLVEMTNILAGKGGLICESVLFEFEELVSMCGGPAEKHRAELLLKCLVIVTDNPSDRMVALPTTRKLAMKNKIVFGTGDRCLAPTLTANMGFVRAVAQTGMSLSTLRHSPRALTGD